MSQKTGRFVVLEHQPGSRPTRLDDSLPQKDTHFDWMFEIDGKLRTWATAPAERFSGQFVLAAKRLAEHRVHYLDFEGDIGGDRGTVRRVLAGEYHEVENREERFLMKVRWTEAKSDQPLGEYRATIEIDPTRLRFCEER